MSGLGPFEVIGEGMLLVVHPISDICLLTSHVGMGSILDGGFEDSNLVSYFLA